MFESPLQQLQVQFYNRLRNSAWSSKRHVTGYSLVVDCVWQEFEPLQEIWSVRLEQMIYPPLVQHLQGEPLPYWRNRAKELDFQTVCHLVESCVPSEPGVTVRRINLSCLLHVSDYHRLVHVKLWEMSGPWTIMMLFLFLLCVMNLGLQARLQQG